MSFRQLERSDRRQPRQQGRASAPSGHSSCPPDNCLLDGTNIASWLFTWNGVNGGTASGTGANVTAVGNPLSASGGIIQYIASAGYERFTDPSTLAEAQFGIFLVCDGCVHFQQLGITDGSGLTLPSTIATEEQISPAPLPAALPLFATGLANTTITQYYDAAVRSFIERRSNR